MVCILLSTMVHCQPWPKIIQLLFHLKSVGNGKRVCFVKTFQLKHHNCTLGHLCYNKTTELCGTMVNYVQTWFAKNACYSLSRVLVKGQLTIVLIMTITTATTTITIIIIITFNEVERKPNLGLWL